MLIAELLPDLGQMLEYMFKEPEIQSQNRGITEEYIFNYLVINISVYKLSSVLSFDDIFNQYYYLKDTQIIILCMNYAFKNDAFSD